jgi:hypothetical protein
MHKYGIFLLKTKLFMRTRKVAFHVFIYSIIRSNIK